MRDIHRGNFALLIAYLMPGFATLWGVSFFSPTVKTWLTASPEQAPTIGGFLYATIASLAAGLTVSTVRWATVDVIHHRTGIEKPRWDFSRFPRYMAAYDRLGEIHYSYYQFYANSVIAVIFVLLARRSEWPPLAAPPDWVDLGLFLCAGLFFAGSRDTLRSYYSRVSSLLGSSTTARGASEAPPKKSPAEPNAAT
ncbi:MAG: hypothetical protein KY475_23075 [Planctomycetes bacterium]|nr:hypothetical protein [Planctomycetota bacterium]